jgi:hypothetical protein
MQAGRNKVQTALHRTVETQTKQEANMTTQGKQARNKAPPHATQTEILQCGTSAEACCAPRIQPEPVQASSSVRDKHMGQVATLHHDSWRNTLAKQASRWCPG